MIRSQYHIEKVFVDKKISEHPFTEELLSRLSNIPRETVSDIDRFKEEISKISISEGKKRLFITEYSGEQVKLCPGTDRNYICCNYYVVNETTNCPLDCSYCILQTYLNNPLLTIYVNLDRMFAEIEQLLIDEPERIWRIGTGELSDSLALDDLTNLSEKLLSRFGNKKNLLFELKTKTVNTERLFKKGKNNFVISWSMNPESISKSEEHKTASIALRIVHAGKAIKKGFLAGFHFDPVIIESNWQDAYLGLIDEMEKTIDPKRIAWISIGSLRYPNSLKKIISSRFPKSRIIYGERQRGLDGKERYVRPLRQDVYKVIYDRLKLWDKDLFIYFCMENSPVWEKVMGKAPEDSGELDYLFAKSLFERFPELDLSRPQKKMYRDERDDALHFDTKSLVF